jgi:type III pantothenate kinase
MIERLVSEFGRDTKTVAIGGLAEPIASECRVIRNIGENLTLEGLRLVWDRIR